MRVNSKTSVTQHVNNLLRLQLAYSACSLEGLCKQEVGCWIVKVASSPADCHGTGASDILVTSVQHQDFSGQLLDSNHLRAGCSSATVLIRWKLLLSLPLRGYSPNSSPTGNHWGGILR